MNSTFNNFIKSQEQNIKQKHYLGIDFEFNKITKTTRDVALMQINLENDNYGEIFVLCQPILKDTDILIKLLTTKLIIKILHGSDLLDLPYLYHQLLITPDNIYKFNKKIDTKILCEYKKWQRCSIYDILFNFKIISQEQLNKFDKTENRLGPLYLINIDINNLNKELLEYSLYDVLYLPELLNKIAIKKPNIYLKYYL